MVKIPEIFYCIQGEKLIKDGDTILTYARSHLVESLFVKAVEKGIKFNIIVADNPPYHEGKDFVSRLSQRGIKSTYTLINGVSYFMKKVDKVRIVLHFILKKPIGNSVD